MARGDEDRFRDERGPDGDGPGEIPAAGWRDIAIGAWKESSDDNAGMIAAGVAFYAFLALVPLLGALILSYGLFAAPATVLKQARALFAMLPGDAAKLIVQQMVSITKHSGSKTGLGLLASLALSLYGAMRGSTAVVAALNVAYEEKDERGFLQSTILSLLITLGTLVVALAGLAAIGALAFLEDLIPGAPNALLVALRILFWLGAALVASFGVALLYRFAPDRAEPQWRWLSPGAVLATLGWMAMSLGFGFYAANFGHYNATYGALGAVVVLLMWLYLSAYILIFGAELNSQLELQTGKATTAATAPRDAAPLPPSPDRAHPDTTGGRGMAGPERKRGVRNALVLALGAICLFDVVRKRRRGTAERSACST